MTKKMAAGGRASSFRDMTAGSGSGLGRLQKTSIAAKTKTQKLKVGGMVKGYADGGPMTMDEIIAANMKRNPGFKMAPGYEASARMGMEKQAADTSPERLAYNARQEKREAAAAAARKKAAARKAMSVSRDAGGTRSRGNPEKSGSLGPYGGPNDPGGRPWDAYEGRVEDPEARLKMSRKPSNFADAQAMGGLLPMITGIENTISDREQQQRDRDEEAASRAKNPNDRMRSGGMAKMAKGGKAEAFEGSAKDMAQDKKLAKKRGMSLKAWEKSSADEKHDAQRSMKGLKKGGKAKMGSGGASDLYSDLADRKQGRSKAKLPDFATAFFGPSIRDSSETRAKLRDIGRRTGLPDPRNQEDTKAGKMSPMKKGGKVGYAAGGMSTAQDGMKGALRPKPTAMAKGGKAMSHDKGCKCMACGGMAKYAKGGKVTFGSMKPLPGTKTVGPIRPTTATGASMKKDGMKGQMGAKASGAKPTNMMKPLGMTKMASGGKVRGAGIAQRGTKFIGEV